MPRTWWQREKKFIEQYLPKKGSWIFKGIHYTHNITILSAVFYDSWECQGSLVLSIWCFLAETRKESKNGSAGSHILRAVRCKNLINTYHWEAARALECT